MIENPRLISRFSLALLGALIISTILVVLMTRLVVRDLEPPSREAHHRLADIWQTPRAIKTRRKTKPPKAMPKALAQPPSMAHEPLQHKTQRVDTSTLNISVAIPAPTAPTNIGLGQGFARDSDYVPIYVPQPLYPRRALNRGREGYAIVEVTITTDGGVRNIRLVEEKPPYSGFGSAALKAAAKLRYQPRVIDGRAEEVSGVYYKFSFRLE